nr:hypothetical protein [Tanacetum cinerariifolium]
MNKFFPPLKTTHLKNEISRFTQRFEEIFGEAWERFKEMLRAFPHHGFMKLAQIDTFYNGLNDNDQDSLNAASGGNLLSRGSVVEVVEWTGVEGSGGKGDGRKTGCRCYSRWFERGREKSIFGHLTLLVPVIPASKTDDRIDKLVDQISTLVDIFAKKVITLAPVKEVEESCVTCGGPHVHSNCDATNSNQPSVCVATSTYNQVAPQNRASSYMAPPGFAPVQNSQNSQPFQVPNNQVQQGIPNDFLSYKKANDQMMRNMQNQINSLKGEFKNEIQNTMKTQQIVLMKQQNAFQNNLQNMLSGFFQNQSSTSGTLPSNTIPNPKGEMKAITTRSGVVYKGPSILTPKKVVERETAETTDKEETNFQGSTAHIQPSVTLILEPDVPKTLPKPNIPYPSRLNDQKLREKATNQKEKFFQIFQDLHFDIKMLLKKISEKLGDPGKFLIPCDFPRMDMTLELADRSITRPKGAVEDIFVKVGKFYFPTDFVIMDFEDDPRVPLILGRSFLRTGRTLDVAREEYAQEMLGFSKNSSGGHPTSTSEPILFYSSPSLTPFKGSDFILEEIEAYLKDESISPKIDHADCDPKGDICLIEKLLNNDPFQLPLMDLKQGEVATTKSSIKEPPKLELKDLPSHLEYSYLEGVDKLPVIISKDLKDNEKEALLKVLKSHKRAIA